MLELLLTKQTLAWRNIPPASLWTLKVPRREMTPKDILQSLHNAPILHVLVLDVQLVLEQLELLDIVLVHLGLVSHQLK